MQAALWCEAVLVSHSHSRRHSGGGGDRGNSRLCVDIHKTGVLHERGKPWMWFFSAIAVSRSHTGAKSSGIGGRGWCLRGGCEAANLMYWARSSKATRGYQESFFQGSPLSDPPFPMNSRISMNPANSCFCPITDRKKRINGANSLSIDAKRGHAEEDFTNDSCQQKQSSVEPTPQQSARAECGCGLRSRFYHFTKARMLPRLQPSL